MNKYRKWVVGHDGHFTSTAFINQQPFWRLATPEETRSPLPKYFFQHMVEIGKLTDADGYGRYADFDGDTFAISDAIVVPSDIENDQYDSSFSHIIWYPNE